MRTVLYPGTFDPITNGHLDLIERVSILFDRVVVGVAAAHHKESALFSLEERAEMVTASVREWDSVEVRPFDGLLVDFAQTIGARAILRGLRAISDYEFETQMAYMNRRLHPDIETLFLPADDKNTFINSTVIKEVSRLGGDVGPFVPRIVRDRLAEHWKRTR